MQRKYARVIASTRQQQAGISGNAQLKIDTPFIPQGFKIHGIEASVSVQPTGSAGTGTSPMTAVIKSVQISDENGKTVGNFNTGLAFGLACAESALLDGDDSDVPTAVPGAYDQDGILAGNAAVWSLYRLVAGFKAKRLTALFNFYLPTLGGYGTQPSSYTASLNVAVLCEPVHDAANTNYEVIAAQEIDSNTRFALEDPYLGNSYISASVFSTDELDTQLTGWTHGGQSYNAEQIADLERGFVRDAAPATIAASAGAFYAANSKLSVAGLVSATAASTSLIFVGRAPA